MMIASETTQELSRKQVLEQRLSFEQRYLSDLITMKKEESAEQLEDSRRRWLNREMEDVRSTIREHIEKIQEVDE